MGYHPSSSVPAGEFRVKGRKLRSEASVRVASGLHFRQAITKPAMNRTDCLAVVYRHNAGAA
jgi:hypothetical protein